MLCTAKHQCGITLPRTSRTSIEMKEDNLKGNSFAMEKEPQK